MGWCQEFGVQIRPGCGHPMLAGQSACYCEECQTVCEGHFSGCPDVWARGPRQAPRAVAPPTFRASPSAAQPSSSTARAAFQPPNAPHGSEIELAMQQVGRTEMVDWFRAAFEGLRADIRQVGEGLARQQSILAQLAEAREAELRVVALADTLPDRLGTAIAAAIEARQEAYVGRVDEVVNSLGTHVARTLPERLGTAIADAVEIQQETVLASVDAAIQKLRSDLGEELAESLSQTLPQRVGSATAAAVEARHDALMEQVDELTSTLGTRLAASMVEALQPALEAASEVQQQVVSEQVHEATAELRESLAEMQASAAGFREQSRWLESTGTTRDRHPAASLSVEEAINRAVDQVLDRAEVSTPKRRPRPRSISGPVAVPGNPEPLHVDPNALSAEVMREQKAELRSEVWAKLTKAKVSRFPGAEGRIPNFVGAEAAADRLQGTGEWQEARTLKANPDAPQWPVRERALADGKLLYMAVPRLADERPFYLLDPEELTDAPRRASSIKGAARAARQVGLRELEPLDLVVTGCVAVGEDGARLGKGGGYSDLEFAIATQAGLIGPETIVVTTVHELQVLPAGYVPAGTHDLWVDFIVTPDRVIACDVAGRRARGRVLWDLLDEAKIAAIPVLQTLHR